MTRIKYTCLFCKATLERRHMVFWSHGWTCKNAFACIARRKGS
jgi:hypothetical protein